MSLDQILAAVREAAAKSGPGQHVLTFAERAVPFQVPVALARDAVRAASAPSTRAEGDPAGEGEEGQDDMEATSAPVERDGAMSFTCSGTASSTSVDWYGTEMSRPCLDDMASQFKAGVGVFVGHGGFFGEGIEWDAEIGVTFGAEVEVADVAQPATGERGAVCKVEMRFEYDAQSSSKVRDAVRGLAQRLAKKRPLGLSIGGWFRDVTYLTDEDGELARIIINKVDLDHLATTRRPANPDCLDMAMLGRAVRDGLAARATVEAKPAPALTAAPSVDPTPAPSNPSRREIDPEAPKLSDSEYEQPPHDYVQDIKDNWPDIWSEGGNERGNEAFVLWTRALDGDDAAEVTDWIREREAWAARHEGDFLLPGVVAQLKWGVVGRRGWDHQREVIEARKEELTDEETGDEGSVEDAAPTPTATRGTPAFADLPIVEDLEEPWVYGADEENEVLGEGGDNWDRYKRGHFWFDPEQQDVKAGYKLPFAKMYDGELRAVWRGVSRVMNVMLGGRGGVDMPDEDRRPVYDHIVRYYEKFGKEPPEYKEASAEPPASPDDSVSTDSGGDTPATPARTEPPAANTRSEEIDMTPQELEAMLQRLLDARGIGTPSQGADDLNAASGRTGQPAAPAPAAIPAPAGAELIRSKAIVQRASGNGGALREDFAGVMRAVTFGVREDERDVPDPMIYRAPTPAQRKATWLGLSHQLRTIGADESLCDLAERSAEVLSLDVTGYRALTSSGLAERLRIQDEAPVLLRDAVRSAAASGHPVFKAPGQREAIARSLTVSNASDKVTTALVSSLLQQLNNVQLGARTQLRRIPGAGTNYQTPKRTVSNTLAEWLADGTAPTEDAGTWDYDTWSYKTIGTRFRVTRKAQAQGMQWGDLIATEALHKGEDFMRQEEVTIFQGDATNNLPTANAPNGLLTLIGSSVSGQRVANTSVTAGDTLSLQKLDETIAKVRGRENKANLRIFASERGYILLNAVLQADQVFQNQTMVAAGFVVQTYHGIPIVESSGIPDAMTWSGTRILAYSGGATTALVVVNLTHAYLVVLTPMTIEQVSATTAQYQDYEMFADEAIVLDNQYGAAYLGGIKVT